MEIKTDDIASLLKKQLQELNVDIDVSESEVEKSFLKEAIKNIINGENPSPSFTEPVGCTIKWKN